MPPQRRAMDGLAASSRGGGAGGAQPRLPTRGPLRGRRRHGGPGRHGRRPDAVGRVAWMPPPRCRVHPRHRPAVEAGGGAAAGGRRSASDRRPGPRQDAGNKTAAAWMRPTLPARSPSEPPRSGGSDEPGMDARGCLRLLEAGCRCTFGTLRSTPPGSEPKRAREECS